LIVPATIVGSQDGSIYVSRLYGDTIEGPWSNTSSETTEFVLEITSTDSQVTIIIQEVQFLWEFPEGTLVFKGKKGEKGDKGEKGNMGTPGPEGPRGPAGACGC
jgi:hypothetical protein